MTFSLKFSNAQFHLTKIGSPQCSEIVQGPIKARDRFSLLSIEEKTPIQSKCWQHTSCLFFVSGSSVNANALPSGVNRRIRSIGICPSRKCGQTLDGDVSMAIVALMGNAGLVSDFFWPFFPIKQGRRRQRVQMGGCRKWGKRDLIDPTQASS